MGHAEFTPQPFQPFALQPLTFKRVCPMKDQLLTLAIQEAPAIIAGLKSLFQQAHPDAPEPTEAEVMAAFNAAFISSLAKDTAWLAQHPAT